MGRDGDDRGERRGFSRRSFLQGIGPAAATASVITRARADEKPPAAAPPADGTVEVTLKVNGRSETLKVEPRTTLLDALRNRMGVTGPKYVCGEGSCGACTVIHDGLPIYACLKLAVDAQDAPITTVEGLARGDAMHPVQQAFVDRDAFQCGFCTPGFVTTAAHLVESTSKPSLDDIKAACAGNMCRCGTYPRIFEAVLQASGQLPAPSLPGGVKARSGLRKGG